MTGLLLSTAVVTFISTALSIWSIVCLWIIFKKAGRKGWEAIIPVWNLYVFFKIAGKTSYFWVLFLLPIVWVIYFILMWLSASNQELHMISALFSWILGICSFILPLIAWLELPYGITKKFGKSNWFYIGMLFLSPIFMGILAFSNEKYEDKEIEKEYSCRKWILISIGVALIIAISDAAITYYKYKALFDYFENAGYENLYDDSDTTDTEYYDDYEVTTKKLNVYDATENYGY